jgi:excisionase family DNA binding protein
MAWGRELHTRPVTTTGELTASKVAAYVAKYATKAAECTGTLDRRITPADHGPFRSRRRAAYAVPAANGRCAMPRLLLTVPEAAEALAISRSKLYELMASGAIASVRVEGSRRIPLTALEEYVSKLLAERTAAYA